MSARARLRSVGLRLRVASVAALVVGVALSAGAMLLLGLLRNRLDTAATTAAALRARDIAALAQAGSLPAQLALPGEESAFVQVVDVSGAVVASSENIEGEPAITGLVPSPGQSRTLTMLVRPLDSEQAMRVVAQSARTTSGPIVVYAGESLDTSDDTVAAVVLVLSVGLPLAVGLVGAVTWWAVGRTLRPVRRITRTMADITANDLHRRVEVPTARDEIGQLATTVNDTLARLDTSVEQQRRFVADASHELRGPLAALRADLEISVTHPDRTEWRGVARDTLSDVERLQHLTDDLLLLARLDARRPRSDAPVDLAAVAREQLQGLGGDGLAVRRFGLDSAAIVMGDPTQLTRLVRNLVHNATAHAATTIEVRVDRLADTLRLQIADDGPGVPAEDRSRVFERFVRLDNARTRDSGGTGLGLAIVSDIVTNHHASITVTETDPHGATFTVEFPAHRLP